MAKQSVTIEGVEYKSRTAAAVAMVAAGKTLTEAAEALGMTYQTVYANTKGATKVGARRAMYRVLALGKSGRRTASEIAKKTNLSVSKVVALLKKNQIAIVSKETRAAAKALKSGKAPRAPKVTEPVVPVIDEPITDEIPEDAAARAAAEADMASAQ